LQQRAGDTPSGRSGLVLTTVSWPAKEAFSALTEGRTPTSAQKEFLDLLINHLTEQGIHLDGRTFATPKWHVFWAMQAKSASTQHSKASFLVSGVFSGVGFEKP
jgi:hypothetical protein